MGTDCACAVEFNKKVAQLLFPFTRIQENPKCSNWLKCRLKSIRL